MTDFQLVALLLYATIVAAGFALLVWALFDGLYLTKDDERHNRRRLFPPRLRQRSRNDHTK